MTSIDGTPPPRGWVRPGEVLLHIGLRKTGTTAVQSALADARTELRRRRILVPGHGGGHWRPAAAMLGLRRAYWPDAGPIAVDDGGWAALVREVRGAPPDWRRVVSAEALCNADPEQVERVVDELGPSRVVIGVRALDAQMGSFWQQRIRSGLDVDLDDWLRGMLEQDPTGERARSELVEGLWIGDMVERWATRVGPDSVTVIVTGGRGRAQLDAFESMLDLEFGVLQLSSDRLANNQGLSREQAEVLLRYNRMIDRSSTEFVPFAEAMTRIVRSIRRAPVRPGSRIVLPGWARPRLQEVARAAADAIRASGVHVIGDLGDLEPAGRDDTDATDVSSPDFDRGATAGAEILSALFESGHITGPHPHPLVKWIPPAMLPTVVRARDAFRAGSRRWRRP